MEEKVNEEIGKNANEIASILRDKFNLMDQNSVLNEVKLILSKYRSEEIQELEKRLGDLKDSQQ